MSDKNRKTLAKIAYLYYVKNKSQSEIATELGIYRTTISRMLKSARDQGIVKIDINGFDTEMFRLENYIKEKYGLKSVDIVMNTEENIGSEVARVGAGVVRDLLFNNCKVGVSWGKTLSDVIEHMVPKSMEGVKFFPLTGGPSKINVRYHVNTLVYAMALKYQGECSLVNAMVVQENKQLAQGIIKSKYFEEIRNSWENLDIAIVGIGGKVEENNKHWLDMLELKDFQTIRNSKAVGEICCRFLVHGERSEVNNLDKRTIAIPLNDLKKIENIVAVAYGIEKSEAILDVIKNKYVNRLVTDYVTIIKMLEHDKDENFR